MMNLASILNLRTEFEECFPTKKHSDIDGIHYFLNNQKKFKHIKKFKRAKEISYIILDYYSRKDVS